MLSVIIPTRNANASLPRTLACLAAHRDEAGIDEIIVTDGGSVTSPEVSEYGAVLLHGQSGRGVQMAAGAKAATGDWLLFLHADTVLGAGWARSVQAHMASSGKAAVFRFKLDDASIKARILEKLVVLRCRVFAMPYGDQGLLVSRALYDEAGGFRPLPLMEDVDLVSRIGRSRLSYLEVPAITSAERYVRDGYVARIIRNLTCLAMWSLGVPPERISRFYK
ncbi:MAG: TIGR04283 family arsenosugar biosynthesis glycosyltransferase [Anderseniella sp.]|uniref:TIGR04283 family arsenosugar biosynthesis glycosyltransferase n=1 Tax=Sulfitobacter pontiacus TaxID=60137 RepID=UPI003272ECB0